jgi:hypothetical protein
VLPNSYFANAATIIIATFHNKVNGQSALGSFQSEFDGIAPSESYI